MTRQGLRLGTGLKTADYGGVTLKPILEDVAPCQVVDVQIGPGRRRPQTGDRRRLYA